MIRARRADPLLLLALFFSAALALVAWLAPPGSGFPAPARVALGLLGGVWAPGYALVALAYPRGRLVALERHALAAGAGLLLVPLVSLATSVLTWFTPPALALANLLLVGALAAGALLRGQGAAEATARSPPPSDRVTLAAGCGALALAALLVAPIALVRDPVPASLAILPEDGGVPPSRAQAGTPLALAVEAAAGSAAAGGNLVVTWTPEGGEPRVLLDEPLDLAPRESRRFALPLPTEEPGAFRLEARWDGAQRAAHATFKIEEAGA